MEGVLARQNERPHRLRKAQLNIRIFTDLIEDDSDDILDYFSGVEATAESHSSSLSQRPKPKAQQLHMAVDPDVMEYVATTSLHEQFRAALAAKAIEINWTLNSKTAVLLYRGEDKSDSWQSECIEEVQTWLGNLKKQDVEVNKDFWDAVIKAHLPDICACVGVESPLVKIIDDSFVVRIVSLKSDAKDLKETLKAKLEEIYRNETRKTYLQEKVFVKHLTLLKRIGFVEKLKEKNSEVEIKIDTKAEEIYFEGPQPHFSEATMKFHKTISDVVEKKLNLLSKSILKVLSSDEGLKKVNGEFERNNVEAVFVIDNEPRIVSTSAAHADKACNLVSKMTSEEEVRVNGNNRYLLKTTECRQILQKLEAHSAVRVLWGNQKNTLLVAGFREYVCEAVETLNSFLDKNCIREEQYKCPSKLVRKYLCERRQDDLRSIEVQLQSYDVKIQTGETGDDFVLRGNKDGIRLAKVELELLARSTESQSFNVKQPGLKKYFASGNGNRLVASVEKNHACVIHVQKQNDMRTPVKEATAKFDVSNDEDDDDDGSRKKEEGMENPVSSTDSSCLLTESGQTISWSHGNIQTQQVRYAMMFIIEEGFCSNE